MKREKGEIPDMSAMMRVAARRRYLCEFELLTEQERTIIRDEVFEGLSELGDITAKRYKKWKRKKRH